jgi:hypothetical protein
MCMYIALLALMTVLSVRNSYCLPNIREMVRGLYSSNFYLQYVLYDF